MKKNGFISVSIVYSFLLAFLLILTLIMTTYVNNRIKLSKYKNEIKLNDFGPLYSTVTFDANGGTVDITSKDVIFGKTYKSLPTPVWEGHEFLGWNGKNVFDASTIFMAINGATFEDGYYNFNNIKARSAYGNGKTLPLSDFEENTQYTITLCGYIDSSSLYIIYKYTDGTKTSHLFNTLIDDCMHFTSKVDKTISGIALSYGSSATVHIAKAQFEKGSKATTYEPYYVTENTVVTQTTDHTLKAIWG